MRWSSNTDPLVMLYIRPGEISQIVNPTDDLNLHCYGEG